MWGNHLNWLKFLWSTAGLLNCTFLLPRRRGLLPWLILTCSLDAVIGITLLMYQTFVCWHGTSVALSCAPMQFWVVPYQCPEGPSFQPHSLADCSWPWSFARHVSWWVSLREGTSKGQQTQPLLLAFWFSAFMFQTLLYRAPVSTLCTKPFTALRQALVSFIVGLCQSWRCLPSSSHGSLIILLMKTDIPDLVQPSLIVLKRKGRKGYIQVISWLVISRNAYNPSFSLSVTSQQFCKAVT